MHATYDDFERELSLQDLLRGIDTVRLSAALQDLAGVQFAVFDEQGHCLLGNPPTEDDCSKLPIITELEPVGWLYAELAEPQLRAAVELLNILLRCNTRYLRASDLHLQTQHADYAELQKRHEALRQSEKRYKTLSEHLDERVRQQVKSLETAQIKLYQSEKLAAVGRLAAGVAHEINNPIGFIHSNLCTAKDYLGSLEKIGTLVAGAADNLALREAWEREDMDFVQQDMKDILAESIAGTDRIAAIVKGLKSFSHINEAEWERADVNSIIRQTCHVAAAELREKAEVDLQLGELPVLFCHPGELGQLLLGLLLNALDAVTPVGKIQFRTYVKDRSIHIEVRDNGCGMSEATTAHIFDPFFTTKDVGKGMGLGLTVCRNIVHAHQGNINIKSKVGVGTLISIILPIKDKSEG